MPAALPRCQLSSLQFSSSWTRRQKHLQSLARMVCTSQGAVWADSQKLPGSCRLLHRICIGLADGEEGEKMHDPTTDLTDVKRDYWTCWFTTYTSGCALSPLVLPEHPSPLSLHAKPNFYSRFHIRGVLQCLQGKVTRTFLLCENQCIFN